MGRIHATKILSLLFADGGQTIAKKQPYVEENAPSQTKNSATLKMVNWRGDGGLLG